MALLTTSVQPTGLPSGYYFVRGFRVDRTEGRAIVRLDVFQDATKRGIFKAAAADMQQAIVELLALRAAPEQDFEAIKAKQTEVEAHRTVLAGAMPAKTAREIDIDIPLSELPDPVTIASLYVWLKASGILVDIVDA